MGKIRGALLRKKTTSERNRFFSYAKFPRPISAQVVVSMENLITDVGLHASAIVFFIQGN